MNFFNISQATNIAFKALRKLGECNNGCDCDCVSALMIANELNVSVHHLSKVMRRLVIGNFISVCKGPKGGFYLKKEQMSVSLLEIYMYMENINSKDFISKDSKFLKEDCIYAELLDKINSDVIKFFGKTKIKSILRTKNKKEIK